jgi:hypothetical protein
MRGSRPACLYHDCLIERCSHAWKDWERPSRLSSNFQLEVAFQLYSVQRVHHVRENVSAQSHVTCDDVWTFFLTSRIFSSFDMTLFISPQAEHKLYFIALCWFCNSSLNELYIFWRKIGLCYTSYLNKIYIVVFPKTARVHGWIVVNGKCFCNGIFGNV